MIINIPVEQLSARQWRIQSFAFVISATVCVLLGGYFVVSGFGGSRHSYGVELDEKINPNDAPSASLIRLPGIGIGRAAAIVAYREDFADKNYDGPAFRNSDDLQKVSGIGPKIVKDMSERLKFEQE